MNLRSSSTPAVLHRSSCVVMALAMFCISTEESDPALLTRHCLFTVKNYICFTGIEPVCGTCKGNNLHTVQEVIGGIVAYDYSWPPFLDISSHGRVEIYPPDLSSLHDDLYLCMWLQPIQGPRFRAHDLLPCFDMPYTNPV